MKKIINRILETVKKHDNIVVFGYFMIILSMYIYSVKLDINDELWNFSFIYKMTNGYEIYKDLNVIVTPFFHYIGEMLFLILGKNYISFRIYNILIFSVLFTAIYSVFKKLKIKKNNAFVLVLILSFLVKDLIAPGANYNILAIFFVFCGIYLELDNNESFIKSILKGIVLFLVFLSKQNIFIFYGIALFLVYVIKFIIKEIDFKKIVKNFCIIISTVLLLLNMYALYLVFTNTLFDFISYCFLGLKEFAIYNTSFNKMSLIYFVIAILEIVMGIILFKTKNISKNNKNINIKMLPFEICMMFISFPIFNQYHIMLGTLPCFVFLIYNIYYIIAMEIFDEKKVSKIINIVICIITIYYMACNIFYLYQYKKLENTYLNIEPYANILIDEKLKNKINKVIKYIEENEKQNIEIKIISYEANLYMNIINRNNKNFDLPFLGNLGKDGKEGLIKQIEALNEGTKILILKETNIQESEEVLNKIKNEYKKVDDIENFYVYQK